MKRIWVFVVFCALTACDPWGAKTAFTPSIGPVNQIDDIQRWTAWHIRYVVSTDHLKTPLETYSDRTGDCMDITLLYMWLVNYYFDEKPWFIGLDSTTGGDSHAIAELPNGRYVDPQGVFPDFTFWGNFKVSWRADYDVMMMRAGILKRNLEGSL